MRILVTNDDGVASPGLHALARAAVDFPAEVMVVAPRHDQSGSGAAVGPLDLPGKVVFEARDLAGLAAVAAYCVDCPPALGVLSAGLGGYGVCPDLVLSGVNAGLNLGTAVLHSGTVGAALTAANLGLPAVAVSLAASDRPHWDTAAAIGLAAAHWLGATGLAVALNVNVPDVGRDGLAGVRVAHLSRFGSVRTALTLTDDAVRDDPGLELTLGPSVSDADPASDAALVRRGFATVTILRGLQEVETRPGPDPAAFIERVLADVPDLVPAG
ncbi:MAG: 5'/3'-nucleotidase SurE [Acidimicrobiales bacterium]